MNRPLTVKSADAARPRETRYELPDVRVAGLFLVVQPSGAKSWAWRYRFNRKPKKLTIGPLLTERREDRTPLLGEAHTLSEARAAAEEAANLLQQGIDPSATRKIEVESSRTKVDTVGFAIDEYKKRYVAVTNRPRTQEVVKAFLEGYVRPTWGEAKLKSISGKDVRWLIRSASEPRVVNKRKRGGPGVAKLGYAVLSRFFGWCVEEGLLSASPVEGTRSPPAPASRDRVLSDDELRLVWTAAGQMSKPFGPMFRLLILTGQRRDEVAKLRWSELDLDDATWLLPASRAKNSKQHAVPLSPTAIELIKGLPRLTDSETEQPSEFVFTTNARTAVSGFSKAKARLDALICNLAQAEGFGPTPWRIHDLRRTVASNLARLGQPIHIVEAILNHRSGTISGVAAVYIRHEFAEGKRRALSVWEQHLKCVCDGIR